MQHKEPRARAFQNMLGKDKVRLIDPLTWEYLHLSGQGRTTNIHHSWLGFNHQAETLRERARNRGEDWTFQPIHRDEASRVGGPENV